MSDANFDACLKVILASEGGYTVDQCGPTMLGVTQRALSNFLGRPASIEQVKALTPATVAPIYRADYWNAAHCGVLPDGLDLMVFDEAVNEGPGTAIRHLQDAIGVQADGLFGQITAGQITIMKIAPGAADRARAAINRLHDRNAAFYQALSAKFPQDERGWLARNDRTRDLALEMVTI